MAAASVSSPVGVEVNPTSNSVHPWLPEVFISPTICRSACRAWRTAGRAGRTLLHQPTRSRVRPAVRHRQAAAVPGWPWPPSTGPAWRGCGDGGDELSRCVTADMAPTSTHGSGCRERLPAALAVRGVGVRVFSSRLNLRGRGSRTHASARSRRVRVQERAAHVEPHDTVSTMVQARAGVMKIPRPPRITCASLMKPRAKPGASTR